MPRLWLINQFANTPDLPGHTRQYEVAAALVSFGWEVEVFASDYNLTQRKYRRLYFPRITAFERIAGISWHWLWVLPYRRNNWRRQLNMLSFCIHLALRLSSAALIGCFTGRRPDLILASSPQLPAAFTSLCIARLFQIPFVLEVRDLWPQVLIEQSCNNSNSWLISLLSWMEALLYRRALLVVVLAKGVESFVKDRGARHTAWLPNGPDLDLFSQRPIPKDSSSFTVLYAGAHGAANGLENVLEAAQLLSFRNVPVHFCFVGDGPEKPALISQAKGLTNVSFQPPVAKSAVPSLMADADAILLSLRPSPLFRFGVSPNKLYDAYAIGRPVITTVPGSINDEVERYRLGVTADAADPQSLANAIQLLMDTPFSQRQAMSNRAADLARTTYSRQRINSEYNKLLLRLIQT